MGGEFPNYAYADPRSFDYSPYVSAMQEASTPATVDSESPKLAVTTNWAGSKPPQLFEGTAQDNLAVWAVRWHDDRGGSGVAKLNWQVMSGDYNSGYVGQTHWSFPASDLRRGATQVSFTAQDIKGHTTTQGACALLKLGRNRADRLRGTRQGDRLVGRSGNDKLLGRAGQDCLLGGRGRDKLKGGSGNDHLIGGPGSDLLISRGGGRDTIRCGPGRHDRAVVDRKDRIRGRGCEIVRRRR
jgi:Ca2+-binding RTX toxin-like protein